MKLALRLTIVFILSLPAFGADYYYAATSAGGNNGADCADAYAYNDGTNGWNISAKQAAGNTLHSCGSFTFAGGTTGVLTAVNSGTSGNPITLKFEAGSNWQAPYFGSAGAIILSGKNYWTIQGHATGVCGWINQAETACNEYIENTSNGTSGYSGCPSGSCSNQQASTIIYAVPSSNISIHDLGFYYVYVKEASATSDENTQSFCVTGSGASMEIFNNAAHDVNWCFANDPTSGQHSATGDMYKNYVDNTNHGYVMGAEGSSSYTISSATIHDNECGQFANWFDVADDNHSDCIHIYANTTSSGGSATGVQLYNMLCQGAWGAHTNACIYTEGNISGFEIFNNIVAPASYSGLGSGFIAAINNGTGSGCTTVHWYNNTLIGLSSSIGTALQSESGCTNGVIENNIIVGPFFTWIGLQSGSTGWTSNYNVLYDTAASGDPFQWNGTFYASLASYQSGASQDANSTGNNPNLAGSGLPYPTSGSSAFSLGTNLTSLGIAPLNSDAVGSARPSSGNWTAGALNQSGSILPTPAPASFFASGKFNSTGQVGEK